MPSVDGQARAGTAATVPSDSLAEAVEGHPSDAPALIEGTRVVTYAELVAEVADVRSRLAGLHLDRGERIGLVAGNGVPFVVALLAAWGVGLVVTPVNPESPWPELMRQLDVAGAETVLVGPRGAGSARQLHDRRLDRKSVV